MNKEWGLTERGFVRPTYAELLDAIEYKARELFGSGVNLRLGSPLGLFMRLYAWTLNLLFQLTEDVYNSRFVDTAAGTSLYNVGKAIGLRLLPAQKAIGYLQITGRPGTHVPAGFLAATGTGEQYAVMAEAVIEASGTVKVPIRACNTGPDGNAGAGTIREIVNPGVIDGIESIINPEAVDGGQLRETDEQYRDRYYKSVDFAGGVNRDAIRGELLQNVEGIYSVEVYENDTDYPDAFGLPPHSFEAVCYGGLDVEIAQAIFRRKAAGIQTYGNTVVPVVDASGQTKDIRFSRPEPVPVHIRIYGLVTDGAFAQDGADQIRRALIAYIGGDVSGGVGIGEPVYFYRLPEEVYRVVGVVDFELLISPDGRTWNQENIEVSTRQKAVTSLERIEVS